MVDPLTTISLFTESKIPVILMVSPAALPKVVLPFTTKELFIVVVPVAAPKFNSVAAPKALTVVAPELNTLNDADCVVTLVVNLGLVPNTATPVPVSSVRIPLNCDEDVFANTERLFAT